MELNQEHADTYYHRGLAHSRNGDYDLAIADYTKAIEPIKSRVGQRLLADYTQASSPITRRSTRRGYASESRKKRNQT